jgi:hypothetical protein
MSGWVFWDPNNGALRLQMRCTILPPQQFSDLGPKLG